MKRPRLHGSPPTGENQPQGEAQVGKFGRMFPLLPPLVPSEAELTIDNAMNDPSPNTPAGDNDVPVGYTYLGQFVNHDITFDTSTSQEILIDPRAVEFRTPRLNLDSVYGSHSVASPHLYLCGDDADLFLIGSTQLPGRGDPSVPTGLPNDLPRALHGVALIADPRNDELIVAQLHLAMLKLHNKLVGEIKSGKIPQESPTKLPFDQAHNLVVWHYQWIVINDFLRRVLDNEQIDLTLGKGRDFFKFARKPFIPVKFSVGAYRLGHSMVRTLCDYNQVFTPYPSGVTPATLELLFRSSGASGTPGNVPIPNDWIIDWRRFFPLDPAVEVDLSRKLDTLLVEPLRNTPNVLAPSPLVVRNLLRGSSMGLPSGQSIAKRMGFKPLSPEQIAQGPDGKVAARHGLHIRTPLWYYILKEGQIQGGGNRLGQVGSRLVAEVFVGLLHSDGSSFITSKPEWKPTLPARTPGTFTMADLLNFVGD